jgi:hypothetical protein
MKKSLLFLSFFILAFCNLFGQNTEIKKVHYAKTEIAVPTDYTAKDEYSIENNLFSAQWLYLTKEMVEQGVEKQIIQQFEGQLKYSKSSNVNFI